MGKTTDELSAVNRDERDLNGDDSYGLHGADEHTASGVTMRDAYATAPMAGYTDEYSEVELVAFDGAEDTGADAEIQETRQNMEQNRADLSRTIDAIQEKLSPQNLAQQAKDTVREATVGKAQDVVSNVQEAAVGVVSDTADSAKGLGNAILDTIRENPIPAALTGLGIGWLYMSRRNHQPHSPQRGGYSAGYDRYGYTGGEQYRGYGYQQGNGQGQSGALSHMTDAAGNVLSSAGDAAGNVAGQVASTAGHMAGQVGDAASGAVDAAGNAVGQVADTASQLAHQAQYQTRHAARNLTSLMHENPMGVGAPALAIGMAVGLAIPETDKENELMGEKRDAVMQQAQHTVADTAHKVQAVAQEAVGAAKEAATDAAQDQGLTEK